MVIGTQGEALAGHLAGDFNGDGTTDYLDRRYDLAYLRYAGTNSHWSLLASVTMVRQCPSLVGRLFVRCR